MPQGQSHRHLGRIPALLVLTALLGLPLIQAAAQTDPRLIAAVHHAQEGQGDSARSAVRRLLTTTPTSDTLYPQMLYTAAVIASDAEEMQRQLQRVAVEFPTSSWTDDALLRLVQLDYASRQLNGAARNLERIALDFPASPLIPQAAYWAGRTYFDLNKEVEACRWLSNGMARSRDDVEIQTQLGYLYQRCGTDAATPAADSAPRPDSTSVSAARPGVDPAPSDSANALPQPAAPTAPAASAATPQFRVQIAAVGAAASADIVAKQAQAVGYATVTVQEGGLYKVRTGEFTTRTEAQQAASILKAKIGGSPFVVVDQ